MKPTLDADPGPESALLQPLDGPLPCGPDLEYDPDFVVLQANVAPRGDAQYGDFVDTAAPVNWAEAERDCRALLARSKDLRLLIVLARCRARQAGAAGLHAALALLDAMLRRYTDALNPVPLLDDEYDPLIVANALAALADPDGLVADVRDISLPKSMGTPLSIRDVERALAKTRAKDAMAPEAVMRMVSDLHDRRDPHVGALAASAAALGRIQEWARAALGGTAPDLRMLMQLLEPFRSAHPVPAPAASPPAAQPAEAPVESDAQSPANAAPPPAPSFNAAPAAAAMNRWDMLETLKTARLWFETHEPSSPISILIKQAERMVGRRYPELHRMVPAELLEQWDAQQD
ncbi:ImpA family type VI secretion system protein [Achromobacter spanius]|uniref:type VI secretion system protein TssA n=1 Tax=Achromobacter spanius TaxID=217203 RepID=UPI0037F8D81E